jgi:DNA-binding beta-propeller fold protein YncE
VQFGKGNLIFEVVDGWGKLPPGKELGEVAALGVDSQDRVYAFNRGPQPMVVFDRDGNFLSAWGEGVFNRAHGLFIGPDDSLYCVDDGDHTVRKCTPEGKVVMTLGVPGEISNTGYVPGDFLSVKRGAGPFCRPTNIALSPEGEIYVADGYGNARVHKFSPYGELMLSWGEPGSGPGEFRLVHGIVIDEEGKVYVGDRMNSRIQVFSLDGDFITQWNDVYQPDDMWIDADGYMYVAELGYNANLPMSGPIPTDEDSYPRVTIRNLEGDVVASLSHPDPTAPGGFLAPHAVRLDSRGDVYVGEVSATNARNRGLNPADFHPMQKFARVRG